MAEEALDFVHCNIGFGFRRSAEADGVQDSARNLELCNMQAEKHEQMNGEQILANFQGSEITNSRAAVEGALDQLNVAIQKPDAGAGALKSAELDQHKKYQKNTRKQNKAKAKAPAQPLVPKAQATGTNRALALQQKLESDPVAMDAFLKDVKKNMEEENRQKEEKLQKEREEYRAARIAQGLSPNEGMPLRLQNVIMANRRACNNGSLSAQALQESLKQRTEQMEKKQEEVRQKREKKEAEDAVRSEELRQQILMQRVRPVNTPVRKQFELAGTLFLAATVWKFASTAVQENRARGSRVLEYRALFVLQRHLRELLRIKHLRECNHSLIIIRNAMFTTLFLRRHISKTKAATTLFEAAEDIETREAVSNHVSGFLEKVLRLQRFTVFICIKATTYKQLLLEQMLASEGDIINDTLCRALLQKARVKYDKELKEWKDLRKINRSKADKMGPPVLERPTRQPEKLIAPHRVPLEHLERAVEMIFHSRIKLKTWLDAIVIYKLLPADATRFVQCITRSVELKHDPSEDFRAYLAENPMKG